MTQASITDLTSYKLNRCKHLWFQGPDTGTDDYYVCSRCEILGYRPTYLKPWIKPYKDQDKARQFVNRMAALEGEWRTIWAGEDTPDDPAWDELAEMAEDWVEPEPEWDR